MAKETLSIYQNGFSYLIKNTKLLLIYLKLKFIRERNRRLLSLLKSGLTRCLSLKAVNYFVPLPWFYKLKLGTGAKLGLRPKLNKLSIYSVYYISSYFIDTVRISGYVLPLIPVPG
ncbi:hypothetical protein XIS1_120009 [Xenorhabdus innexi]|uniref:Uncharacterized protein n=1 Tax=Xenorhabdus innexi TaxID=290109 RepID=A0A1N6MRW1_9GAMM|nr:hypothetical protein XIS1_120009 [Xenorhabdus innexi]